MCACARPARIDSLQGSRTALREGIEEVLENAEARLDFRSAFVDRHIEWVAVKPGEKLTGVYRQDQHLGPELVEATLRVQDFLGVLVEPSEVGLGAKSRL